ncbi:MAG TPA: hypothetical protein VG078_06090 [Acidimicrobiales bacterium]|nr:hypothetical protein [Acidimicrobiales bacterium]
MTSGLLNALVVDDLPGPGSVDGVTVLDGTALVYREWLGLGV